jgi:tetraacyldisaccharide 4'-kinase
MPAARPRSDSPPLAGPLGRAAAWVYGQIISRRNRRFDRRRGVVEIDRPVISVGNLSVGGTGKTPLVRLLVTLLQEHGHRPALAMRGYAPRGRHGPSSDEARDYARLFPDLAIVAQPDRLTGLLNLFATPQGEGVDCVVLDDGFQHRRIARALDIVLISAPDDPWQDRLLPAGWLREHPESLARAHAVVITHADQVPPQVVGALQRRISREAPGVLLATCSHQWAGLDVHAKGEHTAQPTGFLRGRRTLAVCGIGSPAPFLASAEHHAGRPPVEALILSDHDPFDSATRARIASAIGCSQADAVLVTSKDWVKLAPHPDVTSWPVPVVVPRLELRFDQGWEALAARVLHAARTPPPADPSEPSEGFENGPQGP